MNIYLFAGILFIISVYLVYCSLKKCFEKAEEYRKNVTDKCPNCGRIDALRDINKEFLKQEKSWREEYSREERKKIAIAGYVVYYRITRQCRYCGHLLSKETGYFKKI